MSLLLVIVGILGLLAVLAITGRGKAARARVLSSPEEASHAATSGPTSSAAGTVRRRISDSVEATIAAMPPQLQNQWAEEWRAELAVMISAPLRAAVFARGLRHSARELIEAPAKRDADGLARARSGSAVRKPVGSTIALPGYAAGVLKRTVDIMGSSLLLIVCAPLFAIVAVLIKMDSPGNVIFRQTRIGRDGRPFGILKFRTMIDGAEELQWDDLMTEADGGLQDHR